MNEAQTPLTIAGRSYRSRLLVGTGKYQDFAQTRAAIDAAGAEIVTVAIRRVNIGQNAGEPNLLAEYGKSLIAIGRADKALPALMQAQQLLPDDWTVLVAMGVAYDQMRDYANARRAYEMALALSPDNPSILNNLGLSYLMAGDKANAAKYLMAAAQAPGADARVRANLALVSDRGGTATAKAAPPSVDRPASPAPAEARPTPKAKPTAEAEPQATDAPRTMATESGSAGLRGTN